MIDFVQSKIAMIVAAIIITSAIFGVYNWQMKSMESIELKDISEGVSKLVNEISTSDGEVSELVTFDPSKKNEGMYFPATVGGENYEIKIKWSYMNIKQGDKIVSSDFSSSVHLWNPGDMENGTANSLSKADEEIVNIIFKSGNDFIIENNYLNGSGYECHIYLTKSINYQKDTVDKIGNEINDYLKIKNSGDIEKKKTFSTSHDFYALPGLIIFEKSDYKSCYIVNTDHVWDPSDVSTDTTTSELENKDEKVGKIHVQGSYTLEIKKFEITDTYKENEDTFAVPCSFLY